MNKRDYIERERKERDVLFQSKKQYCDYIKILGTEAEVQLQLHLQAETIAEWAKEDVKFPIYMQRAKQEAFLLNVRETGSVTKACEFVGADIMVVLGWAHHDQIFSTDWENLVKRIEKKNRITAAGLVPKAIEVKERILDKALNSRTVMVEGKEIVIEPDIKDLTLANQASDTILKGTRTLDEGPTVAIDQSHRTIKLVIERDGKVVKEIEAEIGKRS